MTQEHDAKALLEGTTSKSLSRQEARGWIRQHFAYYITNADIGMDHAPNEVCEIWAEECRLIVSRILNRRTSRRDLARQVITLTSRAETAEAEVKRLREERAATERDWWKPDPEDPFWMLEAEDGEWLKNKHSLRGTRDAAKALRFPTEEAANSCRIGLHGNKAKWWSAKPTEHLWIALLKEQGE